MSRTIDEETRLDQIKREMMERLKQEQQALEHLKQEQSSTSSGNSATSVQEEVEAKLHIRLLEQTDENINRLSVRLERLEQELNGYARSVQENAYHRRGSGPRGASGVMTFLVLLFLAGAAGYAAYVAWGPFDPATFVPKLQAAITGMTGELAPNETTATATAEPATADLSATNAPNAAYTEYVAPSAEPLPIPGISSNRLTPAPERDSTPTTSASATAIGTAEPVEEKPVEAKAEARDNDRKKSEQAKAEASAERAESSQPADADVPSVAALISATEASAKTEHETVPDAIAESTLSDKGYGGSAPIPMATLTEITPAQLPTIGEYVPTPGSMPATVSPLAPQISPSTPSVPASAPNPQLVEPQDGIIRI